MKESAMFRSLPVTPLSLRFVAAELATRAACGESLNPQDAGDLASFLVRVGRELDGQADNVVQFTPRAVRNVGVVVHGDPGPGSAA